MKPLFVGDFRGAKLVFSRLIAIVIASVFVVALAAPASATIVDLTKTTTSETLTAFGTTTITIVGNNPLKSIITAPAATTTFGNAPTPAFIPAAAAATGNKGVGTYNNECAAATPDKVQAAYNGWTADIISAQNDIDTQIAALETKIAGNPKDYSTDALIITAFQTLATKIPTDTPYQIASKCFTDLAQIDQSTITDASLKASIAALTAPATSTSSGSPYNILRNGGSIPANQFDLTLPTFSCAGLFAKTSATTQAVTIQPSNYGVNGTPTAQVFNISQKCLGQVSVSAGAAFLVGALSQTFSAVNTPNGTAAATSATVQPATKSSFQTIPTAFVHWSPFPSCQGSYDCTFLTFGAGVTSLGGSTANNVNWMFGISQSFSRFAYLTVGVATAQITTTAAGYNVGTTVAIGATVPTQTVGTQRLFLSVSFGTSP